MLGDYILQLQKVGNFNGARFQLSCITATHRGSYMSAHVLLNLLNELGKRDKMRGLPSIISLFCNEFNKFNTTRARMLDSIHDRYFEISFLA